VISCTGFLSRHPEEGGLDLVANRQDQASRESTITIALCKRAFSPIRLVLKVTLFCYYVIICYSATGVFL